MPRTVVFADDHPSFRASARAILESEGFEVIGEAASGASALAAVRELAPDVLLLDVQLPDLDGLPSACSSTSTAALRPSCSSRAATPVTTVG